MGRSEPLTLTRSVKSPQWVCARMCTRTCSVPSSPHGWGCKDWICTGSTCTGPVVSRGCTYKGSVKMLYYGNIKQQKQHREQQVGTWTPVAQVGIYLMLVYFRTPSIAIDRTDHQRLWAAAKWGFTNGGGWALPNNLSEIIISENI